MRDAIAWTLIAATIALVGLVWVRPLLHPSQAKQAAQIQGLMWEKLDKSIGPPPGTPAPQPPPPPPPSKYEKLKAELNDWGGIAGKFSPFVVGLMAFLVKRKK